MTYPSRKRVLCSCHGPIAFGPHYKSPWEDVWLRWKGKPGRKVYRAAPTLVCHRELYVELEMHAEIRKGPLHPLSIGDIILPGTPEVPMEERESWYLRDDEVMRSMLAALERAPYACDWQSYPERDKGLSTVYTKAAGIDRKEAERMLAYFLEVAYGVKNVKFDWKKADFCIEPVSLDCP